MTAVRMPHVPTLLVVSIVHAIPVLLTLSAMERNVMVRHQKLYPIFLYNFLDINECTADTDNCADDAACTNLSGSFSCACHSGFTDTLGDGTQCDGKKLTTMPNILEYFLDVDECTLDTDNCADDAACTNVSGSFTCACNSGFTDTLGDGTQCDGKKPRTVINIWYQFLDIDECTSDTYNCADFYKQFWHNDSFEQYLVPTVSKENSKTKMCIKLICFNTFFVQTKR